MAYLGGRSSSTQSTTSSLPFGALRRCGGEVEAEEAAPHFELIALVHELEEPLLSVDCQSDVMALLGELGQLVVRDTAWDSPPLTRTVRNPYRVFLHPAGDHTLVAATDGGMYYFSLRNRRATGHFILQHRHGLKDWVAASLLTTSNNVAECVCWLPGAKTEAAEQAAASLQCLVGTKLGGFVFQVTVNVSADGTTDFSCRQCLQLPAGCYQTPVASIHAERLDFMWVVFIATATRLYRAEGKAESPTALLDNITAGHAKLHVRESDAALESAARGTLALYRPGVDHPAQSYAWTSAAGVVHGLMNRPMDHDLCKSEAAIFEWDNATAVANEQLLALTKVMQSPHVKATVPSHPSSSSSLFSDGHALPVTKMPMEVALTAFHMILLYDDRLVVLNHPAGLSWRTASSTLHHESPYAFEIEERIRFDPFRTTRKPPVLRGIVRDTAARKTYIFGKDLVWELQVEQEHRHQWWLFLCRAMNDNEPLSLRKRFYQAAYNLCRYHAPSRNLVQLLRGRFYLHIGAVQHATDILADCDRFEDVYHLLVSLRNSKVLHLYVEKRYKLLAKCALNKPFMRPQLASLLALLVVLRLDNITRCGAGAEKASEATASLNAFLHEAIVEQPELFGNTTYSDFIARLLDGEGRPELSLPYAECTKKVRYLLTHYVSRGAYLKAADVLSTYSRHPDTLEVWYEFAPVLMKKCPIRLTTGMLRAVARDARGETYMLLRIERFIPVFIQYTPTMNEDPDNGEHQVIVFLGHCITKFGCVSTAVHDYYLSLLARSDGERLEEFLETSIFYSVDFALRRCLEARRYRQCVDLYRRLHLYADAIRTALHCSEPAHGDEEWPALRVVKDIFKSISGNMEPSKLKKLWLIVVRCVLEKCSAGTALTVLEDSNGVLKLEDVLEDIDDGAVVQNFKDAICKSLDAYSTSIKALRDQQHEASLLSEGLKVEISQLQHRFGYITARQRCVLCCRPLLKGFGPYLIYPNCRHAVHEACAISKLVDIGGVEAFVADEGLPKQFFENVTSTRDLAQMDCVVCGEASILEIDLPLFSEDDSWSLA